MERIKAGIFNFSALMRKLYEWMLSWADHPQAGPALFGIAFAEASFFPIPPDPLLIALAISKPKQAFKWAFLCSAGSVLGGIAGYIIGWHFMSIIGDKILAFYHLDQQYQLAQEMYRKYQAWAVATAGFTPLPYKLFTITAGAFKINFTIFVIASAISRSARFFLIALLGYFFGPVIRDFLEKYFNYVTIIFMLLLIAGFLAVRFML